MKGNHVADNNGACPTGPEGIPPSSGSGIVLAGTHDVTVKRNHVVDNRPTLESVTTTDREPLGPGRLGAARPGGRREPP